MQSSPAGARRFEVSAHIKWASVGAEPRSPGLHSNDRDIDELMIKKISNYCIYAYCIVIFIIFPLFYRDGYHDIGIAKYDFFIKFHIVALLIMCPLILWKEKIEFSLLDKAVLVFLGANVISAILSDYRSVAWRGSDGWYMGLFSQIIFVLIYFCIKNVGTLQTKEWYAVAWTALGGATVVYVLGILNRFSVYPLDMGVEHTAFISTIGNINWFCGYWSIMAPMGIGLYLISTGKMKLFSGMYCFVAMLAGLVQGSTSALLVVLGCGSILLWQAFHSKRRLLVLIELLAIGSLAMETVFVLGKAFPKGMKYNNVLIKYLLAHQPGLMLFGAALAAWLVVRVACPQYDILNNHKTSEKNGQARNTSKVFFAILILVCIFIVCYAVKNGWIVLDEDFGNGRLGIWMISVALIKSMNVRQLLFGVGPDCFGNYLYSFSDLAPKLTEMFGSNRLTNCHCEILNTFINIGLLGAVSFLSVIIIALKTFMKQMEKHAILWLVVLGICGYVFLNVIGFAQIMNMPYIFILMGLGEKICEQ